mgnify:FL=1|jgi:hypothetical protein|tara:strand:+ start:345 stop:686 length:342 start_codon:yes stop_codon:yes gene_type:complete
MQNEIQTLIQKAKADYVKFATAGERGTPEPGSYFAEQLDNFENSFEVKTGTKYIKLIRNNGVWGFIVNTDKDAKFKKGDILKAAGYNAPARNKARGNVFENYTVAWTGPHYLN